MTQHWRSRKQEPGVSQWFRSRWQPGSIAVLNLDHIVCSYDGELGLLVEWKHEKARDKNWRLTRVMAQKLGWWSALFVYATEDGDPDSYPTVIYAEFRAPDGSAQGPAELNAENFDEWVCRHLGARRREAA